MPDLIQRFIRIKKLPFILFIFTIIIMLIAGFKPRGYRVFNRAVALADGKGIRFDAPSIIYSKEAWPLGLLETTDTSFTVSMTITPLHFCECYIARIISFCDTANNENVIIGQFNHSLIIQDVTGGTKREFDCDSVFRPGKEVSVSITAGLNEMRIFVDGKCRRTRQGSIFKAGNVIHPGRIVVGNSPDGSSAWEGTIRSIGIFKKELSEEELTVGKKPVLPQPLELAADKHNSIAFYDFAKESRFRITNELGKDKGLYIPRFFTMLKFNILSLPDINHMWSKGSIQDYIVNFFGFIPFGFLLALLLCLKGLKRRSAIVLATGIGGFFSLFIELVQIYIPTRSSELSDLFLNTLGSLLGAFVILLVFRNRGQTRPETSPQL